MSRQLSPADEDGVEVIELTREEGRALFDKTCREKLGISGEEFARRWDAGEYCCNGHAGHLAMLLPFWR